MKTITLQVGNTDNKLTQQAWNTYVEAMRVLIGKHASAVHFFGAPPTYEPWQNVAWVFTGEGERLAELRKSVVTLRQHYNQESVAWIEGSTELI